MGPEKERQKGTARRLMDRFTVNDWEVARSVVEGLTNAGYDVEIEAEDAVMAPGAVMSKQREVIAVYRREVRN
jgi:hypothetical protein